MSLSQSVGMGTILEMAAASVTTSYTSVGTLAHPAAMLIIKSTLNGPIYLSIDGANNNIWLASTGAGPNGQIEDYTTNKPASVSVWSIPSGKQISVKWDGSAPGSPSGKVVIEYRYVVGT